MEESAEENNGILLSVVNQLGDQITSQSQVKNVNDRDTNETIMIEQSMLPVLPPITSGSVANNVRAPHINEQVPHEDEDGFITVRLNLKRTLQSFECEICFSLFGHEIIICERGHSVCKNCSLELASDEHGRQYCHTCRGVMKTKKSNTNGESCKKRHIPMKSKPTATRNYGLEHAMKSWQVQCCFHHSGCPTLLSIYNYENETHQLFCTYQQMNCPMHGNEGCLYAGIMVSMKDHIERYHQSVFIVDTLNFTVKHEYNSVQATHTNSCVYIDEPSNGNKFLYKISKKEFYGETWYSFIVQRANIVSEITPQYTFTLKSTRGNVKWRSSGKVPPFTTDDVIRCDTPLAAMNGAHMHSLMSKNVLDITVKIEKC